MKYLITLIVIVTLGFAAFLIYRTNHGDILSQDDLQKECLSVLDRFVATHPNNLHCEVLNAGFTGGVGEIYVYTDQLGNTLTINPSIPKVTLTNKNGSNVNK